ncbi:hypothetical protein IWW54_000629 [Coemansia sp. RSA 2705]|nr:hypothetical protein IWW54_000629 [Coemansia sp. RSA 2705]
MRDPMQLYSSLAAHSDDTIYSSTSTAGDGSSAAGKPGHSDASGHKLRRQRSRLGNGSGAHEQRKASAHARSKSEASAAAGEGLRANKAVGGSSHAGITQPGAVPHKPQHGRSVSLLSRFRHAASPSGSPTASESSSREAPSERTLAHSASSGSMRRRAAAPGGGYRAGCAPSAGYAQESEPGYPRESESGYAQRPSVKVLPPQESPDASGFAQGRPRRSMRKRNSLRGDGKTGGFISQLLRGSSRSRSPHHREPSQSPVSESQAMRHFVRSPGTPQSHRSHGSQSPASIDDAECEAQMAAEHFHVSQCPFVPQQQHVDYDEPQAVYCAGGEDGGMYYVDDGSGGPPAVAHHHGHMAHDAGGYGHGAWYGGEDPHTASRLVSSLPVYEPIDMSRARMPHHGGSSSGGNSGHARATRPVLPDARMLAPMASLADICGAGDYNALSNRELRFAVENHMLVEQHRYLIRDLGHARSAISALKQVVQAKEERFEHYEMVNVDLQQRVALLESVLTFEQRQQLACLPYEFSARAESQHSSTNLAEGAHPPYSSVAGNHGGEPIKPGNGREQGPEPNEQGRQGSSSSHLTAESDAKRNNRPLSGYATGYSFSDRPVHQLPRVFSGDYSTSDVQAMSTSVEALASAISSMPRDADSVEDIIASKNAGGASDNNNNGLARVSSRDRKRSSKPEQPLSPAEEPKRRSRFLSALRMGGFGASSSALAAAEGGETLAGAAKQKRRSVSLGNARQEKSAAAGQRQSPAEAQQAAFGRVRADTDESLAASCPTLIPGIAKSKPLQKTQRLSSADSLASSGRYPSGLGLAGSGAGSRLPSQQSSTSQASLAGPAPSAEAALPKERRRKISQRLSFTPQPRRSTSAPSRPHSMRVASRRSWIFQLFGVGGSSARNAEAAAREHGVESGDEDTEDEFAAAKARRRRVMTQSSDEISRYLGKLHLEEPPRHAMGTGSGGLEDVIDDSDEDGDLAGRASLSVAEIRQQTLDALNGTVRGTSKRASAESERSGGRSPTPEPKVTSDDVPARDASGSRWRKHESAAPSIRRLQHTHQPSVTFASPAAPASAAGLGVSVSHRNSASVSETGSRDEPSSGPRGLGRRSLSWAQATGSAEAGRAPGPAAEDADSAYGGSKRWAPAFWAPPPLALHAGSALSPNAAAWSPRNSIDSADTGSAGRRTSDDMCYRSPHGSGSHRGSGGSSSRGSPWELVKIADSRTFPISPSHSRAGSPPARALAFFEDSTVPDSDELTMAARRSLSLRMSRNSFTRAEPLPESDDAPDAPSALPIDENSDSEYERRDGSELPPSALSNPALARVAGGSAAQSKRRSLLWQFNAKHVLPIEQPSTPAKAAASDSYGQLPPTPGSARRAKKWWSSVLG